MLNVKRKFSGAFVQFTGSYWGETDMLISEANRGFNRD